MNTYMVEGWVLWARPYGEHDYLVCLYSRERGKLKAYVKGIRKMQSKLRSSISPFSRSQFEIHMNTRSQWAKIIGVNPITFYPSLHRDMQRIVEASWVCEVLDRLTPLEQPSQGKYNALSQALDRIASTENYRMIRIIFGFSLVEQSGHGIKLDHCTECRTPMTGGSPVWISYSGCICERCKHTVSNVIRIDYTIYRLLNVLKKDSLTLETHSLNRVELDSLVDILNFILRHYLQRPLRADTFRNKIETKVAEWQSGKVAK